MTSSPTSPTTPKSGQDKTASGASPANLTDVQKKADANKVSAQNAAKDVDDPHRQNADAKKAPDQKPAPKG